MENILTLIIIILAIASAVYFGIRALLRRIGPK